MPLHHIGTVLIFSGLLYNILTIEFMLRERNLKFILSGIPQYALNICYKEQHTECCENATPMV